MGKLKQTTAEVQVLLDKVAAGADAQLDKASENAVQNKIVTEELDKKASTTYVDERLEDVEQGVLAYADGKVGKVEDGNIVFAKAQGLRDTDGDEYYDYVLPSAPRPQYAHYVLATTNDIDTAIANAITNTLNTAV